MKRAYVPSIGQRLARLLFIIAVLPLGLPQAAFSQTTEGLVLWLKFDEEAGAATFADSSGGGKDGSCSGDACPTAGEQGKLGKAARFDGSDDKVTANLNTPAGDYTLAAWVNFSGEQWGSWRTILEFGDDMPWFGVSDSGRLTLYPTINGGATPVQQWAHVAYARNGAQNQLYINGKAVATNSVAPASGGQGASLGQENGYNSPWLGLLDDVRVYSRALSAAEIGELANPDSGPAVPPPPPPSAGGSRLIDLTVSIYKEVATAEARQPYEDLFQLFADAIYEVSNGAHKIRNITIYDNARFADRADIKWIAFKNPPDANTNAYPGGSVNMADAIFDANTTITDQNERQTTFVQTLAHEWGHYFYGTLDEYEGSKTSTTDIGSPRKGDTPPSPCSVMCAAGGALDFAKLNFSTPKSTADVGRTQTAHYRYYQASGWETVARPPGDDPANARGKRLYWPDLAAKAPAAGQDPSVELPAQRNTARDSLNIVWADANASTPKRRIFLLDVSADMGGNNKLASAKLALKNYVDRTNVGDMIGIITFADEHSVVRALTAIDGDAIRNTIKGEIDAIQAKAGVNDRKIASADQAAIQALQAAANNAIIVDKGIYVIIDGGYTDNTEPHIFQKLYNDHAAAKISLSVFNYAAQGKANDLWSNSLDLMRHAPTATNPEGTYQYVGEGGFTVPPLYTASANQENANASDLIDALDDADQEYSPILDVNLGTVRDLLVEVGAPFTATIFVDSTLDEVEVAVAFDGAETAAQLTLKDPNGDPFSDSNPPDCDSDGFDTVCFFFASEPMTGTWELAVAAVSAPINLEYEAIGYALDGFTYQAILESLAGDFVAYPDEVVLVASLFEVTPIARAGVTAWVEKPDGDFADLTLKDDGVAPDEQADDGLYTGLMPYNLPGDYYVTVVFDNIDGNAVFSEAGLADVQEPQFTPVPDDFDRFATLELLVDDFAADDHGNADDAATDLLADNDDVDGRIDSAGDTDNFRITSPLPPADKSGVVNAAAGTSERFALRMTHFAFGMDATVRVTTNSGTQEYETGALAYNKYWSTPLDLAPGEVVGVQVSARNPQASGGAYDISFGKPLPGEFASTGQQLYLPVVMR